MSQRVPDYHQSLRVHASVPFISYHMILLAYTCTLALCFFYSEIRLKRGSSQMVMTLKYVYIVYFY